MRAEAAGDPGRWRQQAILGRGRWDADTLRDIVRNYSARQVFDLPSPQPLVVTEHRAHDCRCAACGAKTRAPFPDGVNAPVQYGARITAFVIYLLHYQLLPEDRLVERQLGVTPLTALQRDLSSGLRRREKRKMRRIIEPAGQRALASSALEALRKWPAAPASELV
jgi:transposase